MVHFFESTQEDACVHFGLTAVEMLSTVFSAGVKAEVSSMWTWSPELPCQRVRKCENYIFSIYFLINHTETSWKWDVPL